MDPQPPLVDQIYVKEVLPLAGRRRLLSLIDLSMSTDTLELYVALLTCLWGLWIAGWDAVHHLGYPGGDLSDAGNILNLTFTFLPQWAWGVLGALLGGVHLLTRLQQIRPRRRWLILQAMFWFAVTTTVAIRVPYSTGIVAYGGLALASGLSYLRLYIIATRLAEAVPPPPGG